MLDCLLLGVVTAVLGTVFFDTLAGLGAWCRVIGLVVAALYFGWLESSAFRGQSIGKVLVGLQVVNRQGGSLSFQDAVLRTLILWLPISLNQLPIPLTGTPPAVIWLLGLVVFGLGGTTLYLLLFNRQTRQGVHDLATRSYVVLAHETGALDLPPIWKTHRPIVIGFLCCLGLAGGFTSRLVEGARFGQAMDDLRLIEGMPGVAQGGVYFGVQKNFHNGETQTTHTLNVTARLDTLPHDNAAFADAIARSILATDRTANGDDALAIVLMRGYDFGFWSSWRSERFAHSPAEWRERLGMQPHQGP